MTTTPDGAVLTVEGLSVRFRTRRGTLTAVDDVSFSVGEKKLAIVGESGSGKSLTARAILGVEPPGASVSFRRLEFEGADIRALSVRQALLGRQMSLVLQDSRFALDPVMTAGAQIQEVYAHVLGQGRAVARRRMLEALERVRIRDPERVARLYPHELSGGMGQRVMIAMMLAGGPRLLFADEPTSALDTTVQAGILDLIDEIARERRMAVVFVSHDLDLVARFCDRVLVFEAGRLVETCAADALDRAVHPYTRRLVAAVPRLDPPEAVPPANTGGTVP